MSCLLCKHEDLSWKPSTQVKDSRAEDIYNPSAGEAETQGYLELTSQSVSLTVSKSKMGGKQRKTPDVSFRPTLTVHTHMCTPHPTHNDSKSEGGLWYPKANKRLQS